MTLKQTIDEKVDEARLRKPFVDHLIRMQQHYSEAQGNILAGAATYFAFLSVFPLLAVGFAVVGFVAKVYPQAQTNLVDGISSVLPGIIGGDGGIKLADIQSAAGAALGIGGLTLLYSGLGWLSNLRVAMQQMFEVEPDEKPSFVIGKLKDLVALITLGVVLILSVAVSQVVTSLSSKILEWLQLSEGLQPLLWVIGIAVGIAANVLLFYMFFRLLADPPIPARPMREGALLGAILFEVLKQLSAVLLRSTQNSPAFQAFGIALVLVVWIYYFSRVLMYAAAFAHTDEEARLLREQRQAREDALALRNQVKLERKNYRDQRPSRLKAFAVGSLTTLAGLAAVRRRRS